MSNLQNSNLGNKNRLSDRDILFDLMVTEKQLSHMYEYAVTESSNMEVTNTFKQLQQDEHDNIHTLSTFMQDRGWMSINEDTAQSRTGIRRANRMSRGNNLSGNVLHNENTEKRFNNKNLKNAGEYSNSRRE